MNRAIIRSLLDVDVYKLTMLQFIWKYHRNVPVVFRFHNRTVDVPLADFIDQVQLQEELAHVVSLSFSHDDIKHFRGYGIFSEMFLADLAKLQLRPVHVKLDREARTYRIEVYGSWFETTLWETIVLAVVNELYYRSVVKNSGMSIEDIHNEGDRRLTQKIKILNQYQGIKYSEFGTRRRFSREWHWHTTERLLNEAPHNLVGTSNMLFAKELGIAAIGTSAHELYMGLYGIRHDSDEAILASPNEVMEKWQKLYGHQLLIALTDTYGSTFAFRTMTEEQARDWRGLRQDSGDPFEYGEKAIAFYEGFGIDPMTKLIIFSDGLDIKKMIELGLYFAFRIQVSFGWGTNLTNDLGFAALSLVMKLVKSNGHDTVKLSDNIAKAIGPVDEIERAKRIFKYTVTLNETCVY